MMKHAYLIIAHNEFEVLARLLRAIDDERNDIYIHFDFKVDEYPAYVTSRAGLYILENRIDVRWGDVSMVEAEYALFAEAYRHGGYSYYHLLSGVDMPLKSQNEIHRFFEENDGKEFIGYCKGDISREIDRKVRRWHLFPGDFKGDQGLFSFGGRLARAVCLRVQFLLGIRRNRTIAFKKGPQWISISHSFVMLLLQKKEEVMRIYSHTFCADEIFVQTICWNSSFRVHIYDSNNEDGCLRMIGWKDNQIEEWEEKDFEVLMKAEALFARKFSSKELTLVDNILKVIL